MQYAEIGNLEPNTNAEVISEVPTLQVLSRGNDYVHDAPNPAYQLVLHYLDKKRVLSECL